MQYFYRCWIQGRWPMRCPSPHPPEKCLNSTFIVMIILLISVTLITHYFLCNVLATQIHIVITIYITQNSSTWLLNFWCLIALTSININKRISVLGQLFDYLLWCKFHFAIQFAAHTLPLLDILIYFFKILANQRHINVILVIAMKCCLIFYLISCH